MASKAFALYDTGEYHASRTKFEELSRTAENSNVRQNYLFNAAACLASEGKLVEALEAFTLITSDRSLDVLYNRALCNYKLSHYDQALLNIDELLSICHEKYPEILITRDSKLLLQDVYIDQIQQSCIIEGINLKSAILYKLNHDLDESLLCLNELPIIDNYEQLDCVTLHNLAIYECNTSVYSSISKLNHLVRLNDMQTQDDSDLSLMVPLETYNNLIMICMSRTNSEASLQVMKTNESYFRKYLSKEWFRFFEIYLEQSNNPDDLIYRKLDIFLDQLLGQIKDLDRSRGDLMELTTIVSTYESLILWNNNQYHTLENFFTKIKPYFVDSSALLVQNMAHNLFMMDNKFEESANLYEKLLPQSESENLNNIDPMILGNLCVSYVLTGKNSDAEILIKDVETDEIAANNGEILLESSKSTDYINKSRQPPSKLSIINMIIGTLYCIKFNYEFGLSRMFKTLVPIEHKLNKQVWFYVKRCILSLLDRHCKQMICVKDDLFQQVVSFLIQCEKYGTSIGLIEAKISSRINLSGQEVNSFHGRYSVTYEARYLRSIILSIIHD